MAQQTKQVCIIDDDQPVREHLRHILEMSGYEVHEAANGKEGTECLALHACDIIITDLIMPEKEGFETMREIKKAHPDCKVIAISGSAYLNMAVALGADAVIAKPFTKEDVLRTLSELWPL
ncbi:MAG: response regulator [Chitinivibrionales bacterium]|nr:response regulator [Chitinivibrionales bacterium]